jgi:hypothetical protein
MRAFLFTLLVLASAPALAAPKVVVADLKGDKKGAVTKPLRKSICAQVTCVANGKVGLPKKLDWKKAKKEKVSGVVTGSVVKGKVKLELRTGPGAPAKTWSLTLAKGNKLKPADAAQVRADVVDLVAPVPAPPPVVAPEPEPVAPTPAPAPAPTPAPKSELKPEARPEPKPEPQAEAREEKPEPHHAAEPEGGPPLLHVLVGLDVEHRTLRYSNLTTNNLSEYEAPAIYAPRLQLEAYPLAHMDNPARGLGLLLDYRFAVGLKSAVTGGPSHPTRMSVFSLDARYRFDTTGDGKYNVIPFVGYRRMGFRVDPASDGSTFIGLPKIVTGGVRLGLGADLSPVDKLHLLGQLDYEFVLSKADLISAGYFPSGRASAFELEVGAGYEIVPHLDVQLLFEFAHTGFSFDANPGPYQASGATDTLIGGRLMVGYSF